MRQIYTFDGIDSEGAIMSEWSETAPQAAPRSPAENMAAATQSLDDTQASYQKKADGISRKFSQFANQARPQLPEWPPEQS